MTCGESPGAPATFRSPNVALLGRRSERGRKAPFLKDPRGRKAPLLGLPLRFNRRAPYRTVVARRVSLPGRIVPRSVCAGPAVDAGAHQDRCRGPSALPRSCCSRMRRPLTTSAGSSSNVRTWWAAMWRDPASPYEKLELHTTLLSNLSRECFPTACFPTANSPTTGTRRSWVRRWRWPARCC